MSPRPAILDMVTRAYMRTPASTSVRLTHSFEVCATQSIFQAMDSMAAHSDGYSPRCLCATLTARSHTSGEKFLELPMLQSSQRVELPRTELHPRSWTNCKGFHEGARREFPVLRPVRALFASALGLVLPRNTARGMACSSKPTVSACSKRICAGPRLRSPGMHSPEAPTRLLAKMQWIPAMSLGTL